MKSRLEKVWPPPPPLQLRKLIAKLYGPSPSFLAHFCLFPSSGAFFLSFDGESLCDSPPHSRSPKAATTRSTRQTRKKADLSRFSGRACQSNHLHSSFPSPSLSLSLLQIGANFFYLFFAYSNSRLRSRLPRPSRKLLTERRGRDRLGDREIPSDIMPAVFHGR